MIRLSSVTHTLGDVRVLDGLDRTLVERRIGVIGANGSGKSSFARLLNGLILPDAGAVEIDGLDTRRDTARVRRHVGFVFQNPDVQLIMPTVEEDLDFGLRQLGLDAAERERRRADVSRRFGLEHLQTTPTHALSGGEKQRVALAGVLAMQPSVLVLDEPSTLLDLVNATRLERWIAGLSQQVVLATHALDELAGFDRVLVFEQGRIVADAAPTAAIAEYRRRARVALERA